MYTTYIRDAGIAVVSRRILEGSATIKWMMRVVPVEIEDSGWRVLSGDDTGEYMSDPTNFFRVDFCATSSPPASVSTTCRSAPTSNWSSNLTAVGAGSTTRLARRSACTDAGVAPPRPHR